MKRQTRPCPVEGCATRIQHSNYLMCRKHWFSLPQTIRDEVWSSWRARSSAPGDDDAIARHEAAKEAAIGFCEEHDAERAEAPPA